MPELAVFILLVIGVSISLTLLVMICYFCFGLLRNFNCFYSEPLLPR